MAWWPRQTPSIGTDGPRRRTSSTLIPAFSGRDGPGEMTIASAWSASTSSTVTCVVARDRDVGADAAEQLHDVVGERVVVVEQEDPHASGPPMAASIDAAFDATSAASRSGTESATIPAPAWTVAIPSRMRADLMVMAHSTSVGEK